MPRTRRSAAVLGVLDLDLVVPDVRYPRSIRSSQAARYDSQMLMSVTASHHMTDTHRELSRQRTSSPSGHDETSTLSNSDEALRCSVRLPSRWTKPIENYNRQASPSHRRLLRRRKVL